MITKGHVFSCLAGAALMAGARHYHDDRAATAAAIAHLNGHVRQTTEDLGHEIDKLGVKLQMGPSPTLPSAVDEEPTLRRWSRRDFADNPYSPDDHAEFTGRHDTFDRRPSAGKGGLP